tara:strand:+ start:422 stop:700 length:279 start_codon:yes stop_codon:yes gene_type:complete
MSIINLTNPGKDPVEGDEIEERKGSLVIKYTQGKSSETEEEKARFWRDMELRNTDSMASIPDWPDRDKYLAYRTKLRDWPSTSDFPDTKPTL